LLFSTVIGDGTTTGKIVPSAFMVDNCKRIYIGGFGGSPDWPLTSDALFTNWDQHTQWYLASLSENAASLLFASLYGSWHVDGGTSRFDPQGIVYQAVCADSAEFPVTPWAHADGTTITLWNICAFKIDFQVERDSANLPNVFTPNADGINDVYNVGLPNAEFFELKIFNRWGAEVFSTVNPEEHWDGTYRKNECEEGVYYVQCKHGYCAEEPFITTGFVHLIRGN
jgi:gliding motility-associated-like protein